MSAVRARAPNAGGWGDWTAPLSLETTGAVTAGQCIQDDAPCDDRDGEVLEIDYLYGGAGCAFSPTVELVGGNCFANDTGVNGTGLQPCTPLAGTLDAGNATSNGSGNGSGNISAPTVNGSATANASCVCGAAATATATVADGMVVALNVLSGGEGYTSAPTVVLLRGQLHFARRRDCHPRRRIGLGRRGGGDAGVHHSRRGASLTRREHLEP
jgi:hypothetical protein